jgi:DNA-binding response OmpR family regulator
MQNPLCPVFCLIVEGSPIIGLDLADALDASGYYVAGPFTSDRRAYEWLAQFTPDVAVVDLDVSDGRCVTVIHELQARAIPFIIYSAWPSDGHLADEFLALPWVGKPATPGIIKKALRDLLSSVETGGLGRDLAAPQQKCQIACEQTQTCVEIVHETTNGI